MRLSLMLLLHICAGTLGVLSGAVAISFRKGSRLHRLTGMVFAISMLTLGASGAYMALMKFQPGNILGGTFTFYLVATAWMTAKRRDEKRNIFDWAALLLVLAVAATEVTFAFQALRSQTGLKYGYQSRSPPPGSACSTAASASTTTTNPAGGSPTSKRSATGCRRATGSTTTPGCSGRAAALPPPSPPAAAPAPTGSSATPTASTSRPAGALPAGAGAGDPARGHRRVPPHHRDA